MSDLRALQSKHVRYTAMLIGFCTQSGYELTWGQTLRTPEEAMLNAKSGAGIAHSLHLIKLAVDLSLFKDGVLLESVEDYRPLGDYWKSLDPLCCWGGDFAKPDADHFSLTFGGIK